MTDWHSHILPCMDDGSGSLAESIQLLSMLSDMGIDTVVATPHFYADEQSLESFIEKRERAYNELVDALSKKAPRIVKGAEVWYYPGIARLEGLKRLCIQGTNLLLLELPFCTLTEFTLRELEELTSRGDMRIILAHVERFWDHQSAASKKRIEQSGAIFQFNASYFNERRSRRKALKMLKNRQGSLIGSDCHNTTSRPPRIGEAHQIIENRLGEEFLRLMDDRAKALLAENK